MLKFMIQSGLVVSSLMLSNILGTNIANPADSIPKQEVSLTAQEIDTTDGLRWGARSWPYEKTIHILQNKGDTQAIGRAVLDRHGIDESELAPLLKAPFASPEPVRIVFVSTWSARTTGCSMELLVQVSPPLDLGLVNLSPYLVPTKVQVKLGDTLETLQPVAEQQEARISRPLGYTFYSLKFKSYLPSNWFMARNKFVVSSIQAKKFLQESPSGQANLLVTFPRGVYTFPIGAETTKRWKRAYSFNPECSPNAVTQPAENTSPFRIAPQIANPLPAPQIFAEAEERTKTLLKKPLPGTGVKLTSVDRQRLQAWRKSLGADSLIARFVGAWYLNDEIIYVYPAKKKGFACVVTQFKAEEAVFHSARTFSGNELLYNRSDDPKEQDSLYWRNQSDYLFAKDYGPAIPRPVFATQRSLVASPVLQERLAAMGCNTDLLIHKGS
jgi:hypothetical protein